MYYCIDVLIQILTLFDWKKILDVRLCFGIFKIAATDFVVVVVAVVVVVVQKAVKVQLKMSDQIILKGNGFG